MARWASHRSDATAKALTALAKRLGADVLPLNGVVDALVLHRGRIFIIDWKARDGTLTPAQSRLVARGWPIRFCSTPEQLEDLLLAKGEPR